MSYIANRANAATMIARKGADVTITHRTEGGYTVATGTIAQTDATEVASGILLPLTNGFRKVGEGNVIAGDMQLLLSAEDASGTAINAPQVDDLATINGTKYTIVDVSPLTPDGATAIMYDCVLRGAS